MDDGQERLERFLHDVRRELRGLSSSEEAEVVEELRSHVLDRTGGSLSTDAVDSALRAIGSPTEVARLNSAVRAAASIEHDRSPWRVLRAAALLARVSTRALYVLALSLLGYAIAGGALVVAAVKPLRPAEVGLWHVPDPADPRSFSVGYLSHRPGAHEILGWWIIPIALIVAAIVGYVTWRFGVTNVRRLAQGWKEPPRDAI